MPDSVQSSSRLRVRGGHRLHDSSAYHHARQGGKCHEEGSRQAAVVQQPPAERQQKPKQLGRDPQKPIKERLKADDPSIIELLDGGPSPALLVITHESGKQLESFATTHDLIALVTITDIASELTADKTWITSTVSARIVETLKATGREKVLPYAPGEDIAVPWEGGTLPKARQLNSG